MKYCMKHRVRYSEVDYNYKVGIPQIINYFQDCSTFQSEELGLGMKYLSDHKRAWLLLSWQIEVDRYPEFGEELTIRTWAYDWKTVYGYRNFDLVDAEGRQIVRAGSIWVYTDIEKMGPARPDPSDMEAYGKEEPIDMEYAPRKIRAPKTFTEKDAFPVVKAHIDTNLHVNNAQYVALAEEYLPEDFKTQSLRVYYKQSALLHDMIYPRVTVDENTYTIQLCKEDGDPYAIVSFR